jgi:hypothetical protein
MISFSYFEKFVDGNNKTQGGMQVFVHDAVLLIFYSLLTAIIMLPVVASFQP